MGEEKEGDRRGERSAGLGSWRELDHPEGEDPRGGSWRGGWQAAHSHQVVKAQKSCPRPIFSVHLNRHLDFHHDDDDDDVRPDVPAGSGQIVTSSSVTAPTHSIVTSPTPHSLRPTNQFRKRKELSLALPL